MKKSIVFLLLLVLIAPAFGAAKKVNPKSAPKAKAAVVKKAAKKPVKRAVKAPVKAAVKKVSADVSRPQLTAALGQVLSSLEAKYNVPLAKDLALAPSAKPTTRFELASSLAKTLKVIYGKFELPLPTIEAVKLKDVKTGHWATKDIGLVAHFGIMNPYPDKTFRGEQKINRDSLTVAGARLREKIESILAQLPPEKLKALQKKYAPPPAAAPSAPSRVEKSVEIPTKPQAYVSSGWGNIFEGGSGTNNWLSFFGSLAYGDQFKVLNLSGNYEITGRYGSSQINYIVPKSGGGTTGGVVYENRYDLELNTLYPLIDLYGVSGKLLLGAKYINLSNPTAPTNFTGFNAGLVTTAKVFDRNFLLRGFYSLPLLRASVSQSALGQPVQLFDYEASLDAEILENPVLFGFSGELMTLTTGAARYYNTAFVRYFLL